MGYKGLTSLSTGKVCDTGHAGKGRRMCRFAGIFQRRPGSTDGARPRIGGARTAQGQGIGPGTAQPRESAGAGVRRGSGAGTAQHGRSTAQGHAGAGGARTGQGRGMTAHRPYVVLPFSMHAWIGQGSAMHAWIGGGVCVRQTRRMPCPEQWRPRCPPLGEYRAILLLQIHTAPW